MRILLVIQEGKYSAGGGSNVAAKTLIEYLLSQKVEVHVVVRNNASFTIWLKSKGVDVHCISTLAFYTIPSINSFEDILLYPIRLLRTILFLKPSVRGVRNIIHKVHPDIVHSNNSVFLHGYLAAKKEKIPHVWHLREYAGCMNQLKPFPNFLFLKKNLSKSYTISVTDDIANYYGCTNPNKDIIVYDSISSITPYYQPNKSNYFLFVGSITKPKGIEELIGAFSKYALNNYGYELWIVGSGKNYYLNRLKKKINILNLQDRIKFLGYREDIQNLMKSARALIVSSWVESFGLVTIEAMINGCLVIGKNVYGTSILIKNCSGCEMPYNTERELIEKLEEIDKNGIEYYKERILLAQKIALNLYSSKNNGEKILDFYKTIIEREYLLASKNDVF